MTSAAIVPVRQASSGALTAPLILLLAIACGLAVGNSYYVQPLAGLIAQTLDLDQSLTGFVVALMQIGYVAGLLLVAPLGDLVENRRLIGALLGVAALVARGLGWGSSERASIQWHCWSQPPYSSILASRPIWC